jgi:hypothetical protein
MTFIGKLWLSCTETLNCAGRGIVTAYGNITHLVNLVKYDGYTDVVYHRSTNYTKMYRQEEEL